MFKNCTGKQYMKGPLGIGTMETLKWILHRQGVKGLSELAQDHVLWWLWYKGFQPTGYISIYRLIYCHLTPEGRITLMNCRMLSLSCMSMAYQCVQPGVKKKVRYLHRHCVMAYFSFFAMFMRRVLSKQHCALWWRLSWLPTSPCDYLLPLQLLVGGWWID
jgi:hypothetical protein